MAASRPSPGAPCGNGAAPERPRRCRRVPPPGVGFSTAPSRTPPCTWPALPRCPAAAPVLRRPDRA
eukprot:7135336-Prymnesium_polylepis.1